MATPTIDPTAQWVLTLVGDIAPGDWWRPFTPPPPAYGMGFRPVSVLLIQAYIQMFGAHAAPPPWLIFCKGALSLSAFGLAARAWLGRLGAGSLAAPIAALGLLSAPQLFSAAGLTELDGLGAALTLGLSVLLMAPRLSAPRLAAAGLLLLTILCLKESSAIIVIGVMGVHLVELLRQRRASEARALAVVSALAGALWLAGAWAVIAQPQAGVHLQRVALGLRLQLLAYSMAQLIGLMPLPGVALLWVAALSLRAPPRALPVLLVAALLGLLLMPLFGEINHYEAIYFSSRALMLLGGPALVVPLMVGRARRSGSVLPVGFVLAPLLVLVPAVLLSQNPREDLAVRLFLLMQPALWLLLTQALRRLAGRVADAPHAALSRGLIGVLVGFAVWTPLAGGVNSLRVFRARAPLELAAVEGLARLPLKGAVVLFDDFSHFPDAAALLPVLGEGGLPDGLELSFAPTQLALGRSLPALRFVQYTDPEAALREGRPVHLLSLRRRSLDVESARTALRGDFSWLQHELGVFVPLAPPGGRGELPALTPLQDSQAAAYGVDPTPLDALVAARGRRHLVEEATLRLLPTRPWTIPRRLLVGAGLLDPVALRLSLWSITAPPNQPK